MLECYLLLFTLITMINCYYYHNTIIKHKYYKDILYLSNNNVDSLINQSTINYPSIYSKSDLFDQLNINNIINSNSYDSINNYDKSISTIDKYIDRFTPSELITNNDNEIEIVDNFRFIIDQNSYELALNNKNNMTMNSNNNNIVVTNDFIELLNQSNKFINDNGDTIIKLEIDNDQFESMIVDSQSNNPVDSSSTGINDEVFDYNEVFKTAKQLVNQGNINSKSPYERFQTIYQNVNDKQISTDIYRGGNSLLAEYIPTYLSNQISNHRSNTSNNKPYIYLSDLSKQIITENLLGTFFYGFLFSLSLHLLNNIAILLSNWIYKYLSKYIIKLKLYKLPIVNSLTLLAYCLYRYYINRKENKYNFDK